MAKTNAKNEKKGNNKKLILVIAIAMLLVATVGATFAYFASRTEINNTLNIVTNIENNNGSFITTATNIELNVTASSMQESVANNVAASNTGVLNVEYLSGSNNGITCKYDINYEWISENETNPYTITNILKDEFTYEVTDGSNTIISERNFVASSNRNKQKLGIEYIYNASTSEPTRKTYQINAKFYNLEENQSNNANKNWNIKFYVDNVVCGVDVESTYTLSGVLLDDNNEPIPNATIVTFSEPRYTKTDASGAFTISGLENEEHNIYYVPNNSIVGLIDLSKNDISGLMDTKSGTFDTSNELNEIPLTNNYKIQVNELSEVPISSGNNGGSSSEAEGTLLTTLRSEAGTNETNDFGNWAIINQEVSVSDDTVNAYNLSSNTYVNTIYVGKNPDNYVTFNGEIWRIIGVFNEDSHGKSGEQLVKIIRNDSLGDMKWDNKQNGVGSSTTNYGSNEWSDSQLMFMLNGSSAINKGKLYNGSPMSEYTTSVSGDYIVDKNGYKIMKIDKGNYLSTDENGNSIKNKEVYVPAQATTSSLAEYTETLSSTLSSSALSMVEEVTWHLGGLDTYNDTTKNTPISYYIYERGNQVYGGSDASTTSTVRSTTWQGLIGLMYPSDYGYATSGGSTYDRSTCLGYQMYGWRDGYEATDCVNNSWLVYTNSTSSSKGTKAYQRTISPNSSNSYFVFFVSSYGVVYHNYAYNPYVVRPTVYLKQNINITSGDGSYNNPYQLSM